MTNNTEGIAFCSAFSLKQAAFIHKKWLAAMKNTLRRLPTGRAVSLT